MAWPKKTNVSKLQKHISLYEFCLLNYAKEGDKILDTHLGSGSIAIACHNLGYDLTACELDKDYYDNKIQSFPLLFQTLSDESLIAGFVHSKREVECNLSDLFLTDFDEGRLFQHNLRYLQHHKSCCLLWKKY